jgi:hypothetical protein
MFENKATYLLMGIGILGFAFSLVRTFYLVRRQARERREALARAMDRTRSVSPGSEGIEAGNVNATEDSRTNDCR